jgi:hypothetical protein
MGALPFDSLTGTGCVAECQQNTDPYELSRGFGPEKAWVLESSDTTPHDLGDSTAQEIEITRASLRTPRAAAIADSH